MSDTVKAAVVVVVGLALAAFLNGGAYQVVSAGAGGGGSQDLKGDTEIWAYRLNRLTGEVVAFKTAGGNMIRIPVTIEIEASNGPRRVPLKP